MQFLGNDLSSFCAIFSIFKKWKFYTFCEISLNCIEMVMQQNFYYWLVKSFVAQQFDMIAGQDCRCSLVCHGP